MGPIKNEHVAALLALFVVFYILTNPENAAVQARSFLGFLGDVIRSLEVFLRGLMADG